VAIRRPAAPLESARPGVVSFDLDLTGVAVGTRLLLLALVQGGAGTPVLVGAGLRDVVLTSPQAAARSIEVV
jgi:hypothetical protein